MTVALSGKGIDACLQASKELGSGGKFIKLQNDGDFVVGVFVGDPEFTATKIWVDGKPEVYDPTKHKGMPKPDFKWNFYPIPSDGSLTPELSIIQLNNKTFLDLVTEKAKKYGLEDTVFEVKRKGAKGDTKTIYTISPEILKDGLRKLTPAEKKHIATLALNDLKGADEGDDATTDMNSHKKANGTTAPAAAATTPPAGPPPLISGEDQNALMGRLRVLPDAKREEFKNQFLIAKGWTKLGQLEASHVASANAWCTAVETNLKAEREAKARAEAAAAAGSALPPPPAIEEQDFN